MPLRYLHFCSWSIETVEYLGACRESPLKQHFHSLPHNVSKSKDGARLDKNNYQRTRFAEAFDEQKKALLEKKKIYKASANERRKEIRKGETADEETGRLQRRYLERPYVSQPRGQTQNQLQSVVFVIAWATTSCHSTRLEDMSCS